MGWFGKKKDLADATEEVLAHLRTTDNIRDLQDGQKELADAIQSLSDRLTRLELSLENHESKVMLAALRETHQAVNVVHGSLNDRVAKVEMRLQTGAPDDGEDTHRITRRNSD